MNIEMDNPIEIRKCIEKEAQQWEKQSIYKVPAYMASANRELYTPQVVSIGPYHHGQGHLKDMEVHKRRGRLYFLTRSDKPMKDYMEALEKVYLQLMDSYESLDEVWRGDKERFLELMMVDGCFLLEFLRLLTCLYEDQVIYAANDPIFSPHAIFSIHHFLLFDMIMLENQVPLLALERLLTVQTGNTPDENYKYINGLVISLHSRSIPDLGPCLHVLDITRKSLFHSQAKEQKLEMLQQVDSTQVYYNRKGVSSAPYNAVRELVENNFGLVSRSVIELSDAGVQFEKTEMFNSLNINFIDGVLTLPTLYIGRIEGNKSFFLNVIAFERLYPKTDYSMHSYVLFMHCLLSFAGDVRFLRSKKIILSTEASDDAIVELFNTLAKDIAMIPYPPLFQLLLGLNYHYIKRKIGWKGRIWAWVSTFKKNYLKNPWTITSLVAACFFLALTMAQTYYTAASYYK